MNKLDRFNEIVKDIPIQEKTLKQNQKLKIDGDHIAKWKKCSIMILALFLLFILFVKDIDFKIDIAQDGFKNNFIAVLITSYFIYTGITIVIRWLVYFLINTPQPFLKPKWFDWLILAVFIALIVYLTSSPPATTDKYFLDKWWKYIVISCVTLYMFFILLIRYIAYYSKNKPTTPLTTGLDASTGLVKKILGLLRKITVKKLILYLVSPDYLCVVNFKKKMNTDQKKSRERERLAIQTT